MTTAEMVSSWRKAAADLPHTKTAVTFLIIGTVVGAAWKTATLIRDVDDGIRLLGALLPFALIVLTYHFGNKAAEGVSDYLKQRANGKPAGGS